MCVGAVLVHLNGGEQVAHPQQIRAQLAVMNRGGVKAANTQSVCLLHRAMVSCSRARGLPPLKIKR